MVKDDKVKVELSCNCSNKSERCNQYVSTIKSLMDSSKALPKGLYIKILSCEDRKEVPTDFGD